MTYLAITRFGSLYTTTTDGTWVVIHAYGRDEVYRNRNGLEMFVGYADDRSGDTLVESLVPTALFAQHRLLAALRASLYGDAPMRCPLTYNLDRGRWEALTAGQWQPIDGLPVIGGPA